MNKEQLLNTMRKTNSVQMTEVADILQIKDVDAWANMLCISRPPAQAKELIADALLKLNMNGLQRVAELIGVDVLDLAECIGYEKPYSLASCVRDIQAAQGLKDHRQKANLSISELSNKAGVPSEAISRYEGSYYIISLKDAVKIAAALDISLDELSNRCTSNKQIA